MVDRDVLSMNARKDKSEWQQNSQNTIGLLTRIAKALKAKAEHARLESQQRASSAQTLLEQDTLSRAETEKKRPPPFDTKRGAQTQTREKEKVETPPDQYYTVGGDSATGAVSPGFTSPCCSPPVDITGSPGVTGAASAGGMAGVGSSFPKACTAASRGCTAVLRPDRSTPGLAAARLSISVCSVV